MRSGGAPLPLARDVLWLVVMATRILRPAFFAAFFLACNAGSSIATNDDDPSTSNPSTDPTGNGEAGSNATTSQPSSQPSTDGGPTRDGYAAVPDGQIAPKDVDPGTPQVQLIGRFDKSSGIGPKCSFAGCRIVARFNGTDVSVTLKEEFYSWMDGAPSEWDVIVDGTITQKIVMAPADTKFVLASGLPKGDHTVELYKRSEPQTGTTQFKGFDFSGGTLLAPPARRIRHVEIIGDSSSAGFGIERVGMDPGTDCPGADHAAKYENFHKAYGALLGDLVDAEVFGSVLSGKGIAKNIWHPDKETLPIMFERTIPMEQGSTWDFSEWKADVVVVMAGGNDFAIGNPVDTGPATLAEFTDAYKKFATKLRTEYPQAHLVLTVSPTVDDAQPPGRDTRTNVRAGAQAVVADRNAQGDMRTWFFEPGKAPPEEMTACMGHGTPAFHQRVANELATFIKPKLGW